MPRIIISFSVAFLLLLGVVVLSRITYGNTQRQAEQTERSRTIVDLYYRLDVDLRSAEIFTPTYENSGAKDLYKLYKNDLENIGPSLRELKALVETDERHAAIANRLETILVPNLPLLRRKNMAEIIQTEGIERLADFARTHNLIREGLVLEEGILNANKQQLDKTNRQYNLFSEALSLLALAIILSAFFSQFYLSKKSQWLQGFLESVLNTSQNGILYCRTVRRKKAVADFKLVYANKASEGLLGAEPQTLIGKRWSEMPALIQSPLFDACKTVVETGRPVELEYLDGGAASPRSFAIAIARLKDGVTVSFYESTGIKNTAQELKKNIAALELSNKELEEYAYAASHDLQEPLRKIKTFGTFLRDTQQGGLDEKGRQQLDKILSSAERMSLLIKDLLSYSGLKAPEEFEPVELNEILENVLQDLEVMIAQTGALVTHDGLPEVDAIPVQMNQLFYNLVNNSLKFAKANEPLHLDVSCRQVRGADVMDVAGLAPAARYHEIIFSDNGVGFSQQYARQIFGLFKRLHDKNHYAGSGIGLALCKKVVANHGGVIAANGKEGVGAQFYIYLPVARRVTEAVPQDGL